MTRIIKYLLVSLTVIWLAQPSVFSESNESIIIDTQDISGVDLFTEKIGIMGFSAGGHLASTLGTHFVYCNMTSADSIERISCRPDFIILMYPVRTALSEVHLLTSMNRYSLKD